MIDDNLFVKKRNVNSSNKTSLINSRLSGELGLEKYSSSQLAAMAAAQVKDGALVGSQNSLSVHVKSRHLLSDYDYPEESADDQNLPTTRSPGHNTQNKSNNDLNLKGANMTNNNGSNMEFIFINGTWHLIDLDICYKFMAVDAANDTQRFNNFTHLRK